MMKQFSEAQIQTMERLFTQVVDKKFHALELQIQNITAAKEINKLQALQRLYLKKKTLTMSEISEAQLIGNYTTKTVRNKLRNDASCYKEGKTYKMTQLGLVAYRKCHNIQ